MGGDHDLHWIRKRVLQAEDSHLNEPGVLDAVAEDIQAKLKEDGGWAQESHQWRGVYWCLCTSAGAGASDPHLH